MRPLLSNYTLKLPPFPLAHARRLLRHLFPLQHPPQAIKLAGAQVCASQPVILERTIGERHPVGDDLAHGLGIDADLVLRMGVGAQAQEVEEVVEVYFPVPLGVDIGGQVHASQLSGQSRLPVLGQHFLIVVVRARGVRFQDFEDAFGFGALKHLSPPLVVDGGLRGECVGLGDVEFAVEDRIAGGVFVDVGGAVADPLARDEHGQFDVQLDLAHLERGRVPVAHEVADQAFVVGDGLGALAVRDPRGLRDGGVIAHVVDEAHEAVVEHRDGLIEVRLHGGDGGAQRWMRVCAGLVDLGFLFWCQRHLFPQCVESLCHYIYGGRAVKPRYGGWRCGRGTHFGCCGDISGDNIDLIGVCGRICANTRTRAGSMKHILYAGAAVCALAACDGNTISVFPPAGGGGVPDIPSSNTCNAGGLNCSGDVTAVSYDSGTDTLTITGTPFDDDNIDGDYVRTPGADVVGAGGTWLAYQNDPVGLSPYTAYIRASAGGEVTAGVVNNEDYFDFGYGGSFYSVNVNGGTPGGLATYSGDYVGLRVFTGASGIDTATGDVDMEVDFGDNRVRGFITNRQIVGGAGLPNLILNDGTIANGDFSGTAVSRTGGNEVESGTYNGSFAGVGASTLVGVFVVTDTVTDPDVTVQETGVFIADKDP